jgi:hypothetical protein
LGVEPVKALFEHVAKPLAGPATAGAWYRDWHVLAVDGTTFDVPDSEEKLASTRSPNSCSDCAEIRTTRLRPSDNAVVPGLVATRKVLGMPAVVRDRILAGVPMRRVASLAEVVGPVLYLLSPAAGYMTEQALRLDGGTELGQVGLHR